MVHCLFRSIRCGRLFSLLSGTCVWWTWFTANTIVSRYKLCEMLLTGTSYLGGKSTKVTLDLPALSGIRVFLQSRRPYTVNEGNGQWHVARTTGWWPNQLFPQWNARWNTACRLDLRMGGLSCSGDPENVKIGLSKLTAIMYSQEYQLL